jgi:hypothetical protein
MLPKIKSAAERLPELVEAPPRHTNRATLAATVLPPRLFLLRLS